MKKTIKLTESQLKSIVMEAAKECDSVLGREINVTPPSQKKKQDSVLGKDVYVTPPSQRNKNISEAQLRNIIRESLLSILNEDVCGEDVYDEGRKRTRASYYEIEDYKQVPGMDLCIDTNNLIRMQNPKNRNLDRLIQTMMDDPEVLHMYMDEQDRLHAFFYHGCPPTYTEKDNALDEYFWKDTLGEPSMKGIAKQIPVMLYEHVPDFEEIWNEEKARWKGWREKDAREEDEVSGSKYGTGERATMYNTVPTIGTLGSM